MSTGSKPLSSSFSHHSENTHRISDTRSAYGGMDIQKRNFSPDEVLDIAQSLSSPVAIPEGGFKGAELKRRKSAGSSSARRGSIKGVSPEKPPLALEPVEYVQLDEDTLLPFVDRCAEVNELFQHPSNEKMFKMLKAAFPKEPARQHWMALKPEEWNWDEFVNHLTTLDRIQCPDYAWVFRARQAVRARSVALWEKVGTCLGCDGDLLNAGGEDGHPYSWGGLGLGEEGEYDYSQNQVWIEALEAVDPEEKERNERAFKDEFGEIVEDENEQAAAGMTALLGTIGEGEEEAPLAKPFKPTTAQRAGGMDTIEDPLSSPRAQFKATLPRGSRASHQHDESGGQARSVRSRSFVGLQILTSPQAPAHGGSLSRSQSISHSQSLSQSFAPGTPGGGGVQAVFDRGPGSPLFPSSFSSLSAEPNLGRSATVGIAGGIKPAPAGFGRDTGDAERRWSGIRRRKSGAELSESESSFRLWVRS